jgi:3-oxoacyl-[acyl-carrier protein] reductase
MRAVWRPEREAAVEEERLTSKRVALVTGGSRNIGRAIALDLASRDHTVYVSGRTDSAALRNCASEIRELSGDGGRVVADLENVDEVLAMVERVAEEAGGLHVLVNNAAIRPHQPMSEITRASWDHVQAVNLRGAFFCAQRASQYMAQERFGRIINIAGVDAYWGTPNRCHVVASKAGLIGLTRALASELSNLNITANCVVFGFFDTVRSAHGASPLHQRWRQARLKSVLLKRAGRLEEATGMVSFLASDQSSYITGQDIHINGGGWPTLRGADSEYPTFYKGRRR